MAISVFDIFRVGIGPSSSHTVGPMRAAVRFVKTLEHKGLIEKTARIRVEFMGSLGATGIGHSTDTAFVLGLCGYEPETVDVEAAPRIIEEIKQQKTLPLAGGRTIPFDWSRDIAFSPEKICRFHTNALDATAFGSAGEPLYTRRYYSVGGGFVVVGAEGSEDSVEVPASMRIAALPYRFRNMSDLIVFSERDGLAIPEIIRRNERVWRSDEEIDRELDHIWDVMKACMELGFKHEGELPGPWKVLRRAAAMKRRLDGIDLKKEPIAVIDWVQAYAFASGEENAAGGRIVTAPTNGSAGVIPAVLRYYERFIPGADKKGIRDFLLTAGAIGILFKTNGSISGAEVGCQGEVGVACSMAAAGLTAVLGGSAYQIENAAEIGIEHNLGLTCDPVAGQVQIPCIERNAMAAGQAIAASRLALGGNGRHYVSLDEAIHTMLETGRDMCNKYKETSTGGLAVCIVEC